MVHTGMESMTAEQTSGSEKDLVDQLALATSAYRDSTRLQRSKPRGMCKLPVRILELAQNVYPKRSPYSANTRSASLRDLDV